MAFLKKFYLRLKVRCLTVTARMFWYLCRNLFTTVPDTTLPPYIAIKSLIDTIDHAGNHKEDDVILIVMHKDLDMLSKYGFLFYNIDTPEDMNYLISIMTDLYHSRMSTYGKILYKDRERRLH